jgi:hypothetical protein
MVDATFARRLAGADAPARARDAAAGPADAGAAVAQAGRRWPWRTGASHDLLLSAQLQADALHTTACHPAQFAAWCAQHRGQACRLWLGAELLHTLALDPALPLGDDAALRAYAAPLLRHYHGEAARAWPLAAWHAGGGLRGVVALHGADLAALQATARTAGVRLLSVGPWWRAALAQAAQALPAALGDQHLLIVEGTQLHHLHWQAGTLQQLQQRRLAEARWSALADWWTASAPAGTPAAVAGHGLANVSSHTTAGLTALAGLNQVVPSAVTTRLATARTGDPQPDFLRPDRAVPPLAWAAAATALAVLAASGWDGANGWQQRADAVQHLAAAQARWPVTAPATAGPAVTEQANAATAATAAGPRTAPPDGAEAAERQRLAYPWPLVWQAAEAATVPGVTWLGLSHQAGQTLALEGRASTADAALAATGALRQLPGWQRVLLGRLDRGNSPGQTALDFSLSAWPAWLAPTGTAGARP